KSELQLAYQPLVDVSSDKIVGCEALLRWPQGDGSFLSPAEFVPIAESSGLMIRIGEFVLDTACQQLAAWQEQGVGTLRVSVNVSKCQLATDGFPRIVERCLRRHDVDPGLIDLELSERGVLSGSDDLHGRLRELKQLGVSLSIDDFGTGESAISYLKDLPVDILKIDRSYVMELNSAGNASAITSAMVALGQKLNLTVVAEGVETAEQLASLRAMGCDQYQGFFRAPALSPDELIELIKKHQ
ncbi:MAG: putative bifunctional diguanylate cyclase/phosphodiesterase, partial [Gammaproteobacteria bacterium]